MNSSLQDKTIRPGSLNGYYYYSDRRPREAVKSASSPSAAKPRLKYGKKLLFLLAAVAVGWFYIGQHSSGSAPASQPNQAAAVNIVSSVPANPCGHNVLGKNITISVSERHLWACQEDKAVYDSPVITGLRGHAETETPAGKYKIYAKETNTTLTGADSRGAWRDPVYYWMPFLDNQYGTYGFHDATWRPGSDFGKISPDSHEASHGCVELPLAASKWLYDWAPIGTDVTVES